MGVWSRLTRVTSVQVSVSGLMRALSLCLAMKKYYLRMKLQLRETLAFFEDGAAQCKLI